MRSDAMRIIDEAISGALPDTAVERTLSSVSLGEGRIVLVSIGKAAWQMAAAACRLLGDRIFKGIVITKYGHSKGPLSHTEVYEAGHPEPDENSVAATKRAIELVSGLKAEDAVIFLVSGGGSALFELPLVPLDELADITGQLLGCGAGILEINSIRKRLSAVKGGRFAALCSPARVVSVVLSDVLGDRLDMIASGPAYPDTSTCAEALGAAGRYGLRLSGRAAELLGRETPKQLPSVESYIAGGVGQLCQTAAQACKRLGYNPFVLTKTLDCTASDAGRFLAAIARDNQKHDGPVAFIAGGETVVRLTGNGLGGRNQELALSAAAGIEGLLGTAVFSVGSDGTDGPTDAAGGYCDGTTAATLRKMGISISDTLRNNDSYHALKRCGGLIVTGPTGTNVNDLSVVLIKK